MGILRKNNLRDQFIGRDDDFWNIEPGDGSYGCEFRDSGISGVVCTGYALAIRDKLGNDAVTVFGYSSDDNPASSISEIADGHDFAVVDDRYIVDPWVSDIEGIDPAGVYDLENPGEEAIIRKIYGDRDKWEELANANSNIENPTLECV